jgi:hypothetical protein
MTLSVRTLGAAHATAFAPDKFAADVELVSLLNLQARFSVGHEVRIAHRPKKENGKAHRTLMEKGEKIFVAGHRGLVGSAIVRKLERDGFHNLVTRSRSELDLGK